MNIVGSGTVNGKIYGSAILGTLAPTTSAGIEIDLLNGGDSTTSFTGSEVATVQLVVRKDTSFNWGTNNPTLAEGEIAYSTDDKWFCIGDGVNEFNDLDDSHFYVNWLDILNFVNSQTSGITTSIGNIQSDISTIQSNLESSNTFLSQLQEGLNDAVADISSLQSDISSEASTRSTAVTGLQGQIDTLSGGVMKRFELEINLAEIDGIAQNNLEIIVPTSGKAIMPLRACSLIVSDNLSVGQSSIKIKSENKNDIFEDLIISDDGSWNGLTIMQLQKTPSPLSGIDGKVYLYFTIGDTWTGANGTLKLTIFYMEV